MIKMGTIKLGEITNFFIIFIKILLQKQFTIFINFFDILFKLIIPGKVIKILKVNDIKW